MLVCMKKRHYDTSRETLVFTSLVCNVISVRIFEEKETCLLFERMSFINGFGKTEI